ncbi:MULTISPECIES: flagellar hook protein FlgE [Idiomarinaceae]|uniref:Flagellar hook protein FlgE n=1 Tax=Pseudidiomarina fusca TaxID=2965078 RepID=A0ABU3KYS0_9GAMM|nr:MULTISPECIES: flagellar hook protein FlgE [Idiomarinaceae]MDT7526601.1 flagellar hook protein FlgE [Pseudidiomarina sp. GXY010]MRJ42086.1 flagellar hook-basal body complex protein [Idiomarina sp. FeN1]NCU57011.1 flagellar hook-basal body complex protein [Idiomarina sp. FenA--70]NCU59720.1 flagellar hook-basal body complex protein [Idiomarina sp. FenBw--71]UUN13287.1 flagellar hook protein FlgE [Idiomarina loihiensis]
MGFSQALSGLRAAATNLDVISNNIANSQIVGFKSSRAQFADIYANAEVGLGTRIAGVFQDFSDGNIETTNRTMDLAITGKGFFRFEQQGQIQYSRNGQLSIDKNGYIVNAQGARLTGYPDGIGFGGQPQVLQVPASGLAANASTGIEATFNLDTSTTIIDPATTPFDMNNPDTYSYANSVTLYDSLGNPHQSMMYFTKVADNQWQVRMSRDGELAPETGVLDFDANGLLVTQTDMDAFTFTPGEGAADMSIALDVTGTTQFANQFELTAIEQDGYQSGTLMQVAVSENGDVVGTYSNEQQVVLGTIALANFQSLEGLQSIGNNAWIETQKSGVPIVSVPGEGQFGGIMAGAVEASNVDLTQELVAMIIAQRNYQANAQSIKSQDEALQTTMQLK